MPARDECVGFLRMVAVAAVLVAPSTAAAAEPVQTQLRVQAVVLPACRASTSAVDPQRDASTCTNGTRVIVTTSETPPSPGDGASAAHRDRAIRFVTITY